MEKIVTKIGDVTIERRVSKQSLQKFPNDSIIRNNIPQNSVKNQLDDLTRSFPECESFQQGNPNPDKQYGQNAGSVNASAINPMSKGLDLRAEKDQKITLPKGISWDYRAQLNAHNRVGNWNEFVDVSGVKNISKFDHNGSQSRVLSDIVDMSRFSGISIERKRPERYEILSSGDNPTFTSSKPNYGGSNIEQSRVHGDSDFIGQSSDISLPYPLMDNFQKGKNSNSNNKFGQCKESSRNQHFPGKEFSSKSPMQLSSNDEKLLGQDIQSNRKGSDSDEDFDDKNFEEGFVNPSGERGKVEDMCDEESPIVLSSEEDERNEEDVLELVDQSKFINLNSEPDNCPKSFRVEDTFKGDSATEKHESKQLSPDGPPKKQLKNESSSNTKRESEIVPDEVSDWNATYVDTLRDCKEDIDDDINEIKESVIVKGENSENNEETDLDDNIIEKMKQDTDGEDETIDGKDELKKIHEYVKMEQDDEESALKSTETRIPTSDSSEADEKEVRGEDTGKEEISDIDLMELMKKGEIEGEVEDDKEYESEEDGTRKRTGSKRKAEEDGEKDESKLKTKKKKSDKTDEGDGKEEDDKNIDKSKVTSANLRKNIREVMDETKLDEATLSAQRQEAERLKRLQDQQRIIRELQKQIVMNRQGQKSSNRVLSLLQGNSQTSILKTSSAATQPMTAPSKSPNHVLVKLSNGQQTSLNNKKMIELLKNSKNKDTTAKPTIPKTLLKQGMVSPSVSIAPIAKKEPPVDEKKKKKGDVVTLSSDSEDDCIVLSEEDESEPEEDPTNSGMHTSDKYNVPDDLGRVVVNVGHPEAEADIFLAPQIARIIKPHQIGGIRFLYDNVIESLERFQSSTGFGCILAHSMGLGKTLQIVSFSDIFLRYTSAKTILCIMPINTIQNWLAEFNMWLPKESTTNQDVRCRDFDLYIVNESLKNIGSRSRVILDWHRNGGVLLMGYELFRLLSLKKSYKSKKKKKENVEEDEARNKELIEEVYGALVRPGPDLVICDEGHRIKNSHATTSQALKQIRTKRRIVLTGYPLQNNLLEYWCMVDFVRPNYLGSKTEFSNMFERPIQNGQCIDSTPQDKRLMRYRAHVLHSLLEGFVQRRSHAVLQSTLPEKEEYVLLLRFTSFQRKLYDTFMNEVVRTVAVPNPLKAFAVCCKIWNHPDVLYNFLKKKGEEIDLDLEEALPTSLQPSNYPFGQTPPDGVSQFPASPMAPPWPKRGPGSRGGKVRQSQVKGRPRGRKPAATVSPNLMPGCEKKDGDGFNNYSNYNDFQHQNSGDSAVDGDRMNRNFAGRSFNQFGSTEYGSHANFTSSGYDSKHPLENLEDLSSADFQNKRYYPQQGDAGLQGNFPNQPCMQQNTTYPQTVNQSNNPDSNSGFNNNVSRPDSRFSQSDTLKQFQYNQEYNSDFYHASNFQHQQSSEDFEQSKMNFNRTNPAGDPYYQNSRYDNRENNMGYGVRSNTSNMDSGYHGYPNRNTDQNFQENVNKSYHNSNPSFSDSTCGSNPGLNYQNPMIESQQKNIHNRTNYEPGDSNYHRNGFPDSGSNYSNYRDSSNFGQTDSERDVTPGSSFQGSNYNRPDYPQDYWPGSNWGQCGYDGSKTGGDLNNEYLRKEKFTFESEKNDGKKLADAGADGKPFGVRVKSDVDLEGSFGRLEDDKCSKDEGMQNKKDEEIKTEKKEEFKSQEVTTKKEDQNLPYDWATDLFKNYVTGIIENSSKMEVFFHILTETINLGDRLLVFSQSLLTLDLIEDYLHHRNVPNREEKWAKNRNYFRLDGSTPGLEREKLINEFNSNPSVHIFLVSTRAGSLGINLVGANRVVVFDASWNPCHDTQAVCRVYRYGQQKPCFVYRLVMDSCLEKKIYDRQINKQGMADRVVDELNPDAHLSMKEVTNLCWDDQEDTTVKDFAHLKDKYKDQIIKVLLENCSKLLSKEPFQHESLLIDRKEKKLSQAEKRLAKRSYELEKQAANQPKNIYSFFPNTGGPRNFVKPVASVRPMQNEMATRFPPVPNRSKWIPAEVWQKQGMSAQEMTLPLDVVIPRNTPEKTSIVLKAGQRVMILKSPKGIYMQLENGKIIAIRTAFKVGQGSPGTPGTPNSGSLSAKGEEIKKEASLVSSTLKNNPNVTITSKSSNSKIIPPNPFIHGPDKKLPINITRSKPMMGKTKPLVLNRKFQSVTPEIRQRLLTGKPNFDSQDEKSVTAVATLSNDEKDEIIVTKDMNENSRAVQDVVPEQAGVDDSEKANKGSTTLETLRKVTENINKDESKPEGNSENMNQKNYISNFSSQLKSKIQDSDEEKEVKVVNEVNNAVGKNSEESSGTFSGNENVQNWLMNQSYTSVDPYGNYFPSYYGYGHGAGSMVNPYEGLYTNNYPITRTGSGPSKQDSQVDSSKPPPYQQSQIPNAQTQNTTPRGSYPSYTNPYQYPYNYPNNPGFNNQNYPLPGQNQNNQQQQPSMTPNPSNSANPAQNQPYDNPMYSAFHRPEGHFQGPEGPFPTPYRPSYPNSSTPGFFPYNAPYRPYPDPNYHYGSNFNPYMHPPGYGYTMQNPTSINGNNAAAFSSHNSESAANSS